MRWDSPKLLLFVWLLALLAFAPLIWRAMNPPQAMLSRWAGSVVAGAAIPVVQAEELALPTAQPAPAEQNDLSALDRYNAGSVLQDSAGDGAVQFFRRSIAGGSIAYMVVTLNEQVSFQVVSADGATPGSDSTGDTIWLDGQRHLAPVSEIANAPYAARAGQELIAAMAFGFHGDLRTSNEGTVVVDGQILRVNPGRAALCITPERQAMIGLFNQEQLASCQQAIGAGPVVLRDGKIANTAVTAAEGEFIPYNPLNEDFVQIDWRRMVYDGNYPKSIIGIGTHADGTSYLVLTVSYGVTGIDVVRQLRDMGCTDALGGDDDSSTQAVWRGTPIASNTVRSVPDAVAIYVRQP